MRDNGNSLNEQIYIPTCKICDGLLNITINPLNFSVNYECEFNNKHCNSDIYFKTFERFYLKGREIIKCTKCNLNLENSKLYKCQSCKCVYCCKCCFEDIRINNHKNIIYEKNINKCIKHNWNYNSLKEMTYMKIMK